MDYPMSYKRLLDLNDLRGDYDGTASQSGGIRGDLRRLEIDSRDEHHLSRYAEAAGITKDQARMVLDCFFDGFPVKKDQQVPQEQVLEPITITCKGLTYNVGVIQWYNHAEGWWRQEGSAVLKRTRVLDNDILTALWRATRRVLQHAEEEGGDA